MSKFSSLEIDVRNTQTHADVSAVRAGGFVPGILYGASIEPQKVSINEITLKKLLEAGNILSKVFSVKCGSDSCDAVVREIQFHPVTDRPMHIDFMRVTEEHVIKMRVPVKCVNAELSPSLKKGGVLNVVIREIDVCCSIKSIPESIEVDLSGVDFHHTIKLSDLKLPNGCKLNTRLPLNAAVVTVVAPSGLRSEINKSLEGAPDTTAAATEEETPAE